MDKQKELIAEIASQIVNEQLLSSWKYYAIMLVLYAIGAALAAFAGAYLAKRGESRAAAADFAQLKAQLTETTRLTKNIESAVAHGDWAKREFRTIRRTKLEELMTALYETREWIGKHKNYSSGNHRVDDSETPFTKASMLALLYFPELRDPLNEFYSDHHQEILIWAVRAQSRVGRIQHEIKALEIINSAEPAPTPEVEIARMEAMQRSYDNQLQCIDEENANFLRLWAQMRPVFCAIEDRARTLMTEVFVDGSV